MADDATDATDVPVDEAPAPPVRDTNDDVPCAPPTGANVLVLLMQQLVQLQQLLLSQNLDNPAPSAGLTSGPTNPIHRCNPTMNSWPSLALVLILHRADRGSSMLSARHNRCHRYVQRTHAIHQRKSIRARLRRAPFLALFGCLAFLNSNTTHAIPDSNYGLIRGRTGTHYQYIEPPKFSMLATLARDPYRRAFGHPIPPFVFHYFPSEQW